ncbi:TPA: BppU family phage baseplate upper protein [Enterococcus faecium]|uniref:BppU family phage baseplate upper protein n=2 Tax=Enterococcus faecium TaxID=1352 RepID=UPI0018D4A0FA|nr:BppU family phage baseplate upper protein [Enterococcus faecium]QPQ18881.1 BppU family phage baseplate upper protein [Enterococcus faecium]HAP8915082.1 BppU family phage baseplate upper protein [Enterococcus faecium]HAQ5021977.1 BppU family phage baseplate upper protein [Enterococcus faecium]HBM5471309.1 BppU family phage baseplate upper protein [Enterococcus faecium]HBM5512414.1 BppU family phage baseplate upper protein [Enterococcus faecium]
MFKINESIIVIQAEATSPNRTNVVFWSHDRGTAKLRMQLVRKNEIPQSLPEGTVVPIRLIFKSATAEGGYGKHDYLATIEDRVNGIVSIVLEDNILGYVGSVEGSIYIDFPNDRSLDTAGRFTFYIKRSPIDDSTPELEDYYFNGFSQTIDKVEKILADGKQEIDQKITESETQIDAKVKDTNDKITKANQDVATLNTDIDKANDRIDQTNQQISDLGKLKKMYSNSIDFGNYDYSGNPNLMANINADSFSQGSGALSVVDDGDEVVITLDPNHKLEIFKAKSQPALVVGKTYTMSVEIMLEDDFTGDPSNISLRYIKMPSWLTVLYTPYTLTNTKGVWQKLTVTAKMTTAIDNAESWFIMLQNKDANNSLSGKLRLRHAKLEEGSTATPFQPNLLAEPYNMCREYPNENIADPKVKFPIESGDHQIYQGYTEEELMIGQTYTITLKGTKPASQTFVAYNHWTARLGELKPVDGLTDVWSLTFTPTNVVAMPKLFRVYQYPRSTVGACQIDWLKIEKGNTRTPNISEYKYFGEGLKDSNNPNDYSWDITTEYTEKALTNTLNLTDPQTALGLKNFKDGAQIDGVDVATVKNLGSVLQSGSGLTTIQSDKQSAFDEFSYEFERIGDRVFFHARVKTNSTTAAASHVNLLEIPLGFQFPIGWTIVGIPLSVVQWTTPQGEISALVITDSNGKQVVKFATNRVGNHYISGEWRTADSYPETK